MVDATEIHFDGWRYRVAKATSVPKGIFTRHNHRGATWDILEDGYAVRFQHSSGFYITDVWADTSWGHWGYFNVFAHSTNAKGEGLYDSISDTGKMPSDGWYKFPLNPTWMQERPRPWRLGLVKDLPNQLERTFGSFYFKNDPSAPKNH
mgnify:FL=1